MISCDKKLVMSKAVWPVAKIAYHQTTYVTQAGFDLELQAGHSEGRKRSPS